MIYVGDICFIGGKLLKFVENRLKIVVPIPKWSPIILRIFQKILLMHYATYT